MTYKAKSALGDEVIAASPNPFTGTVSTVAVITANGLSGTVATPTSTPAITLTLGAITPTTVNGNTVTTGTGTLTLATYTLTAAGPASVSGTNTGDNAVNSLYSGLVSNATHSGDVSGATTLTIGSTKVTNAMLNADVFSSTHTWSAKQTHTAPVALAAGTATALTAPLYLTAGPLLTNVEPGAMEYKGHTLYFTTYLIRRSVVLAQEILIDDVVVGNTNVETTIYSIPMAATYLTVGKHIEIDLQGKFTSVASGNGLMTLRVKYAGATVATVVTQAGANTNSPFNIVVSTTCRAIGSGTAGKLISWVEFAEGSTTVANSRIAGALTNIDTTLDNTLTITAQWATTDTGNTMTVQQGRTLCADANT